MAVVRESTRSEMSCMRTNAESRGQSARCNVEDGRDVARSRVAQFDVRRELCQSAGTRWRRCRHCQQSRVQVMGPWRVVVQPTASTRVVDVRWRRCHCRMYTGRRAASKEP